MEVQKVVVRECAAAGAPVSALDLVETAMKETTASAPLIHIAIRDLVTRGLARRNSGIELTEW